ncbi:MAG: hypothetical protein AAGF95_18780 [Chloroflexota bacterium]
MNKRSARLRTAAMLGVLILLLPIIAACTGGSTAENTDTLPTADIATAEPEAEVELNEEPATEEETNEEPDATEGEQPADEPVAADLTFPLRTPYLEVGVVSHLYYTDRERILTLADAASFDWVRQQISWADIEGPNPGEYAWDEVDNIINDVAAHGELKLLVSVVRSPEFEEPLYNPTGGLPDDPTAFGNFIQAMAERYGNKIDAYEIWNEPNLAWENGGRVVPEDAGTYVELLIESFNRIKAVSPEAYVIAAPPSSTGVTDPANAVADETYFREMYSYRDGIIKDYFDAQGVHPGGSANPPDTLFPENPSTADGWTTDPTFYFRHIENIRRFMVEEGVGDHQMWVTEFGWATENNTPGYEFGNQTSLEEQNEYILGAIERTFTEYVDENGEPWVGVMFLWNMNFAVLKGAEGEPLHEQASFGILNPDWSPRPSFLGLQGYLPQLHERQGR